MGTGAPFLVLQRDGEDFAAMERWQEQGKKTATKLTHHFDKFIKNLFFLPLLNKNIKCLVLFFPWKLTLRYLLWEKIEWVKETGDPEGILDALAYLDLSSFLSSLQLNFLCLFCSASQANNIEITTALVLLLSQMSIEELVFFY